MMATVVVFDVVMTLTCRHRHFCRGHIHCRLCSSVDDVVVAAGVGGVHLVVLVAVVAVVDIISQHNRFGA